MAWNCRPQRVEIKRTQVKAKPNSESNKTKTNSFKRGILLLCVQVFKESI